MITIAKTNIITEMIPVINRESQSILPPPSLASASSSALSARICSSHFDPALGTFPTLTAPENYSVLPESLGQLENIRNEQLPIHTRIQELGPNDLGERRKSGIERRDLKI